LIIAITFDKINQWRDYHYYKKRTIIMKIIIIGDGKVGNKLARQLSEQDYDVVVIDNNVSTLRKSIDDLDINCVEGNGASSEILAEAGVSESDLVIACTSTDELNMLSCLIARKLGAKQTIARVRNPLYFQQMDLIKEDLGLSMSVNPDFSLSEEIVRILIFPAAIKLETFVKGRVELVELKIEEEGKLSGLSLIQVYKKYQIKILVCAVQRDNEVYIPDGSFVLAPGDKIHVAASRQEIKSFFKIIGKYRDKVKTVMICGGSKSAYYLSRNLLSIGMDVKIIEKNKERCYELSDMLPKARIIHGDAADHELLIEEGLDKVDAFLALTGMDEENIIMSIYAKTFQVPKIITKVNNDALLNMAEQLGLDCVISPKNIIANTITSYVRAMQNSYSSSNVQTLYRLIDDRVEALEFIIREHMDFENIPLKSLKVRENTLIACIVRKRRIIIPGGNDVMKVGDSIIVITKNQRINKLSDILAPGQQEFNYEL